MYPERSDITVVKQEYEVEYSDIDQVKKTIREIRINNRKLRPFEINESVSDLILEYLIERGEFYHTNAGLLFYKENNNGRILYLTRASSGLKLTLSDFGLNPTENIMDYVIERLVKYTFENGKHCKVYSVSHYAAESNTLYLNCFKENLFKITTNSRCIFQNGENGILFINSPDISENKSFSSEVVNSQLKKTLCSSLNLDVVCDNHEKACLAVIEVWFWSIFFSELLPTRPILSVIGEKGSGKTTLLKIIGRIIYGRNFNVIPMPSKQEDFETVVTNCNYAAFDNADSYRKWLPDALASSATGGNIAKRKLYTTNHLITFSIIAFIAITARDPKFKRDDVIDRLIIIPLRRFGKFRAESDIFSKIEQDRNVILTEIMDTIQTILSELKNTEYQDITTNSRMADFAKFAVRIAPAINYNREEMEKYISIVCDEQQDFLAENDPLLEIIDDYIMSGGAEDLNAEHTTKELYSLLKKHSDHASLNFPSKNTKSFGHRLSALRQVLKNRYSLKEHTGNSRQRYWRFKLENSKNSEN